MSDFVNKDYSFTIREIYKQLWGYKNFLYFPNPNVPRQNTSQYDDIEVVDYQFKEKSSFLNTPIIMPLKMQISAKGSALEMFDFPNEPIVEITGSKRIIQTDIDGQDGTFKELYSLGDYGITIRGVAVDENYDNEDYPEDIVRKLRRIWELRHHLEVIHPLFTIFNIKYVALTTFNLPPIEGAPSMAPYEFTALSDKNFDLELKELTSLAQI